MERYYIMIPPAKGIKGGPVEVPPDKLHIGILTELYVKVKDNRGEGYARAYGVEALVKTDIDPQVLLNSWQDLMQQTEVVLSNPTTSAKEFSSVMLEVMANMPQLLQLLAEGKVSDANTALLEIGYGLIQAAGLASSGLGRLETLATRQGDLAEVMTGIVVKNDEHGLYAATAESLAEQIDNGLRAHRTLIAYEAELDALYEQLEPKSRAWRAFSESTPTWLLEQLEWLSDNETGFCTRASRYLISPDPDTAETMGNANIEARNRLQKIRDRIAAAKAERTDTKIAVEKILEQQFGIERLIKTMRECRDAVATAGRRGIDAFSIVRGLITPDEFDQWKALLTDPQWQSLHAVNIRLQDKTTSIRQLLDVVPGLPKELPSPPFPRNKSGEDILISATSYIERLESALAEFGLELEEAEAAETELNTAEAVDTEDSISELDSDRVEELYELIIAIGAVKYCGSEPLRIGNLNSMMDILLLLNRMTAEEIKLYKPTLCQRLDRDSYKLEDGESRLVAWQEVDPSTYRWIQFRQGRGRSGRKFWVCKLVEQAKNTGLSLCVKHGLDPNDIVKAFEARKDVREKKYRNAQPKK